MTIKSGTANMSQDNIPKISDAMQIIEDPTTPKDTIIFKNQNGEDVGKITNIGQDNTYTCAKCGVVFESDRPDEEALGEALLKFGYYPKEDMALICDDCYKTLFGGEE